MFARTRRATMAGLMLITALAVTGPAPAVGATTFVVDTTSNDPARTACTAAADDCSLPGAVAAANATGGVDTITFAIPAGQCPDGVCPINITQGPMTTWFALLGGLARAVRARGLPHDEAMIRVFEEEIHGAEDLERLIDRQPPELAAAEDADLGDPERMPAEAVQRWIRACKAAA